VGEGGDSPQISDKKLKIFPNGAKYLKELRISSPRFKVNLSQNIELKLLSSSNHKMAASENNSVGGRGTSALKQFCESAIDKSNQRMSYSQLMLQTFSKLPHPSQVIVERGIRESSSSENEDSNNNSGTDRTNK
jgi:hypothetical protein